MQRRCYRVLLAFPPLIWPMSLIGTSRNAASLSRHWSRSWVRWTSTRVFVFRAAMRYAAATVLPKAVPAHSMPSSCSRIFDTAVRLVVPQLARESYINFLA